MSIELFSYGSDELRTTVIDGEPWFVLADLCRVLDLTTPARVAERIDPAGVSQTHISSGGQRRSVTIVNEPGMYEVVIRSDKPEAVVFRRWITAEVLPALRKTGTYSVAPALTGPALMAAALVEAQATLEARDSQIAVMTPKADYVDTYVTDNDLMKLRTVAAVASVGETWLRDKLLEKGWIYFEEDSRWSDSKQRKEFRKRYSAKSDKRAYFRPVENHEAPRFKGETMHTLKVTPRGATAIANIVRRWIGEEQA